MSLQEQGSLDVGNASEPNAAVLAMDEGGGSGRGSSFKKTVTERIGQIGKELTGPSPCEADISAARSSTTQGVLTSFGSFLKKTLKFAGPTFAEAMGHEEEIDPSSADQFFDESKGDERLSGVDAEDAVAKSKSLVIGDTMKQVTGMVKSVLEMGEVEMQEVIRQAYPEQQDGGSGSGPGSSEAMEASSSEARGGVNEV